MRIVLVTGDAPYLGGTATWAPFIAQNPQWSYVQVDLLACGRAPDLRDAMIREIAAALRDADAIVAHGSAAGPALEAVASAKPSLPVLLLSPRMVTKDRFVLKILRGAFRIGSPLLRSFARAKRRKLLHERGYIEKQLDLLVCNGAVSAEIVEQARAAIADARLDPFIDRTAEVVGALLTPLDERVLGLANRRATVGEKRGAAMLDNPAAAGAALRRLVGNAQP